MDTQQDTVDTVTILVGDKLLFAGKPIKEIQQYLDSEDVVTQEILNKIPQNTTTTDILRKLKEVVPDHQIRVFEVKKVTLFGVKYTKV